MCFYYEGERCLPFNCCRRFVGVVSVCVVSLIGLRGNVKLVPTRFTVVVAGNGCSFCGGGIVPTLFTWAIKRFVVFSSIFFGCSSFEDETKGVDEANGGTITSGFCGDVGLCCFCGECRSVGCLANRRFFFTSMDVKLVCDFTGRRGSPSGKLTNAPSSFRVEKLKARTTCNKSKLSHFVIMLLRYIISNSE